jgi:hypothetical protein
MRLILNYGYMLLSGEFGVRLTRIGLGLVLISTLRWTGFPLPSYGSQALTPSDASVKTLAVILGFSQSLIPKKNQLDVRKCCYLYWMHSMCCCIEVQKIKQNFIISSRFLTWLKPHQFYITWLNISAYFNLSRVLGF